jgi:hypothetical protein
MYSLPFQNNVFGSAGRDHKAVGNVLNIQPVLPFTIGKWNIISRTIAPVIFVPGSTPGLPDNAGTPTGTSSQFGLGAINQTAYISPAAASGLIWGAGPSITVPTATSHVIGSGKLSMGPAAVALDTPKPWVIGVLGRQSWSVAGPNDRKNVNQLLLQPFVTDNLADGWYLVSAPILSRIGLPIPPVAGQCRSAAASEKFFASDRNQSTHRCRRLTVRSDPTLGRALPNPISVPAVGHRAIIAFVERFRWAASQQKIAGRSAHEFRC